MSDLMFETLDGIPVSVDSVDTASQLRYREIADYYEELARETYSQCQANLLMAALTYTDAEVNAMEASLRGFVEHLRYLGRSERARALILALEFEAKKTLLENIVGTTDEEKMAYLISVRPGSLL